MSMAPMLAIARISSETKVRSIRSRTGTVSSVSSSSSSSSSLKRLVSSAREGGGPR